MQLVINIDNSTLVDKIIWFLESFQNMGVEIVEKNRAKKNSSIELSDEYIEKNWQKVVSEALLDHNESYEKSFQYKIDRADFQEFKGYM